MGLQRYDEHIVNTSIRTFTDQEGTDECPIWSPSQHGGCLDNLIVSSSAAIAHDLRFKIGTGNNYPFMTVSIPAGAGRASGTPAVDAMTALPATVERLIVDYSESVVAQLLVALSEGEMIVVFARGGNF